VAELRRWPGTALLALAALAILAGVYYFAGASGAILNGNDDQAAYLIFPKKILGSGTLIDPFSMRRITTYGGHSFLQALAILGAPSTLQASLLDLGICTIVALLLIVGAAHDESSRLTRNLLVLPAFFLVTLQNTRFNSASEMSGVVFFLAMFRTATSKSFAERPLAGGMLVGGLGAVACTLRQSYLAPVGIFMIVLYRLGRWTWVMAAVNVPLGLLFAVPAVWLLANNLVLNTAFFEALEVDQTAYEVITNLTIGLVIVFTIWDWVDGFYKAYRARHPRG
jgi:hypothetical protein